MLRFFKRPSSWKAHFEQGMSAGSAGDLQTAAKHFKKASDIKPDEPYPHYELGYTLFLLGQYADALDELKKTNELSPGFFLVQTEIYMCEGVLSGMIDDDVLSKLRRVQRLTDTGQHASSDAVSLSHQAIDAAPDCALGHYFLGKALVESDRAQSETALERCMELAPDDTTAIDALTHIGLQREAAGDLAAAREIWTEVLRNYRGNPHVKITELILAQRATDD
jgi:tetratricopeptide (TPR) repeat protein